MNIEPLKAQIEEEERERVRVNKLIKPVLFSLFIVFLAALVWASLK